MRVFDVVIAGNGVMGMTLARELTKLSDSLKIAVVGLPERPGSASLAAGAMINVWGEIESGTENDPCLAAKFQLAKKAMGLWDEHARSLSQEGEEVSIVWGSYVLDSRTDLSLDDGAFDQMLRMMSASGVGYDTLAIRDLPFLAPDPRFRPTRAVGFLMVMWKADESSARLKRV